MRFITIIGLIYAAGISLVFYLWSNSIMIAGFTGFILFLTWLVIDF